MVYTIITLILKFVLFSTVIVSVAFNSVWILYKYRKYINKYLKVFLNIPKKDNLVST